MRRVSSIPSFSFEGSGSGAIRLVCRHGAKRGFMVQPGGIAAVLVLLLIPTNDKHKIRPF